MVTKPKRMDRWAAALVAAALGKQGEWEILEILFPRDEEGVYG